MERPEPFCPITLQLFKRWGSELRQTLPLVRYHCRLKIEIALSISGLVSTDRTSNFLWFKSVRPLLSILSRYRPESYGEFAVFGWTHDIRCEYFFHRLSCEGDDRPTVLLSLEVVGDSAIEISMKMAF